MEKEKTNDQFSIGDVVYYAINELNDYYKYEEHIGIVIEVEYRYVYRYTIDFGTLGVIRHVASTELKPLRVNEALLKELGFNYQTNNKTHLAQVGYPFFVNLEGENFILYSLNNLVIYKGTYLKELIEKVPYLKEKIPLILGKKVKKAI